MFKTKLYVRVGIDKLHLRNVKNGREVEQRASPGFSHPRALIGNFTVAQAALTSLVKKAKDSGFVFSVGMVIHPTERLEGGLTQVEERVLHELAIGSGASKVVVWVGPVLSDAEVVARL